MTPAYDCLIEKVNYDYVVSANAVREVRRLLHTPRAAGMSSMWQDRVHAIQMKLQSFSAYRENWDSYGAKALDPQAVANATTTLNTLVSKSLIPFRVSATGDGSIIFECSVNNGKLLLEVGNGDDVGIVWKKNGDTRLCDTDIKGLARTLLQVEDACL